MTALTLQIADAVKDLLAAQTFSLPVSVDRVYDWLGLLEDLQVAPKLLLFIVPGGIEGEWESRHDIEEKVRVDVGLCQKLKTTARAEMDARVALVEEVQRFLLVSGGGPRHLATDPDAICEQAEIMPIYSPQWLQKQIFLGIVHCTFQVFREV
jgi:hypothetical protein